MKYVICAYFAHINPDIPTFYKFPDGYMNSDMVFGPIDEAVIFEDLHEASFALRQLYCFYGTKDVYCIHVVK